MAGLIVFSGQNIAIAEELATPSAESSPADPSPSADPIPEPTPEPTPEITPESLAPDPAPTESVVTEEPAPTEEPSAAPAEPLYQYIVTFASGTTDAERSALLAGVDAVELSSIPQLGMYSAEITGSGVEALRADPLVTRVETDNFREVEGTPSDPGYGDQWALPKIGWDSAYGTVDPAGSATVAVLDTGVNATEDLSGKLVDGSSMLEGIGGTADPNGHGTAMASIVAAGTDNGTGIAGVGYDGVSVMPVKVLDEFGLGQDSDIVEGVVWAADNGADVILMSFSNPGYSFALQAAVDYAWSKGAVLVAATGNDGSSTSTYPAGTAKVVGVSATTLDDSLWAGSNYGADTFLGAPGVDIATGSGPVTGTSASAAIVAGAAALVAANDSSASNGVVVGRLARNADAAGTVDQTGNGRVNVARALADTSTDVVVPQGVAGDGGPVVGPYRAANKKLALTFAGTGGGTIAFSDFNPAGSAANCIATCERTGLDDNLQGKMTVTPSSGSTFVGWSGSWASGPNPSIGTTTCSGTANPCTFHMGNASQALTATFSANTAPVATAPTFSPSSPVTGSNLTASSTLTDANGNTVRATFTWRITRGTNTCVIGSSTTTAFATGSGAGSTHSASLDLGASHVTTTCTGVGLGSVNPSKGDVITAEVTPFDGTASGAMASASATVGNTAPVVTLASANDLTVDEGQSQTYAFSVSDPDGGSFTVVSAGCGANGTQVGTTSTTASGGSLVCRFPDGAASSVVSVQVKDSDDALSNTDTQTVDVVNVAPVVTLSGAAVADEGDIKSYTYTATDVGADSVTVTESCGPGAVKTDTLAANEFKCSFPDGPASYTVSVDANDGDLANNTDSDSITVDVVNVAPVVTLSGAAVADEGDIKSYTYTATDVGADSVTVTESCGPGAVKTDTLAANEFKCSFPDGPASYTVSVDANDGDLANNTDSDSITVDVVNVAPVVTLVTLTDVDPVTGSGLLTATFTEPGDEQFQPGSGFSLTGGATVGTVTIGARTAAGFTMTAPVSLPRVCGNYTVTATVDDRDGGVATQTSAPYAGTDVYQVTFKAPLVDGEKNLVKSGNVVPVKVGLASSCTGVAITSETLHVQLVRGIPADETAGGTSNLMTESVSNADSGTLMRLSGDGYMYNLSTPKLIIGQPYTIRIRVGSAGDLNVASSNSTAGSIIATALLYTKK